jgi:hypothetical protein
MLIVLILFYTHMPKPLCGQHMLGHSGGARYCARVVLKNLGLRIKISKRRLAPLLDNAGVSRLFIRGLANRWNLAFVDRKHATN